MSEPDQIYIGRQPILDRRERVVAYEILFRACAEDTRAIFPDRQAAATRVIANTFATLGADAVLGPCCGYFNVTQEFLLSELVEALPRERVTLEILEDVEPGEQTARRCRELRERGFSLALDDFTHDDQRESLLGSVDAVKVDLLLVDPRRLPQLVRRLRRHGVTLLAEKVETREQRDRCQKLGFELFQGFYFARPAIVAGARIDPARAALLHLLELIGRDADTVELSEPFKQHADLGVNLLRLVNSAALARPSKIGAVRDAIAFLGRRALARWLHILLYAGIDPAGLASPLLITAARRGRIMELLLRESPCCDGAGAKGDGAFLVGMLSLLDVLLGRPLAEIVDGLGLREEIHAALLERRGTLGGLLLLVEDLERGDFAAVAERAEAFGVGAAETARAELAACRWVHALDTFEA